MSDDNAWNDEWLKAQQKFIESWRDMSIGWGNPDQNEQAKLWANGLERWRKAQPFPHQLPPETDQVINKCMEVGKGYFAMAEQIGKQVSSGGKPEQVVQQWLDQLKAQLQQQPDHWSPQQQTGNEFMSQWMEPSAGWQKIAAAMMPAQTNPGSQTDWGMGNNFGNINQLLAMPGVGFFRESEEKQKTGIKLLNEYQQANHRFNQSFLRVSAESLQSFQKLLSELDAGDESHTASTLRGIYDLWVEVSEASYADFALSEEYQTLYADMVNSLMRLKRHYSEVLDDNLASMNLPTRQEVDTMQERLQQSRRENRALRRELKEIRGMLDRPKPSVKKTAVKKSAPSKKKATRPAKKGAQQ